MEITLFYEYFEHILFLSHKHVVKVVKLLELTNARFQYNGVLIYIIWSPFSFWLCVAQES